MCVVIPIKKPKFVPPKMLRSFSRQFSTNLKIIPIHETQHPLDTGKLHLINQSIHRQLGPIYSERLGPDVNAVWISDPK